MYGPKMDRFWAETDSFPQWYGRSLQICRAKLGSLFNQVRQVLYGAHFGKCLITFLEGVGDPSFLSELVHVSVPVHHSLSNYIYGQ